ncbi:tumor protein p63-regulated gene 1 protein isoform X1 [Antennarius striatus]|uniref:tumor protein p63-regulated gene 1 protein isoform X1 n=1 Tax=Antennarius striatus TaxID=241820 RepID=UPI0035B361F8
MSEAEGEGMAREQQQQQPSSPKGNTEDTPPAAGSEQQAEVTEERAEVTEEWAEVTEEQAEVTEERAEVTEERAEVTEEQAEVAEERAEVTEERAEVTVERATEVTEERVTKATKEQSEVTEQRAAGDVEVPTQRAAVSEDTHLEQFKLRKFFVLRPGTLNQAMRDVEALVDKDVDGSFLSMWLMTEVDHWNNEKERLVLITDNSLLILKYDFVMFCCDHIHRIPLNFVDRICHGYFSFPKYSLFKREGEGLRIYWDRMREPSLSSRWNPFASDYPFISFTHHPVKNVCEKFAALCDIEKFRMQLTEAAQKAHVLKPVPGKANGVMVLNHNIPVDIYVGVVSFLGNQNKLGYCMARGNVGF